MSDWFYNVIWTIGSHPFISSGLPTILHCERTRRAGAYLLASNHHSPFDVPLLIRHCARKIDFVSSTEVFSHRFARWFFGNMNAFPLDRSRPDAGTIRIILDRLKQGRVVGIFPEGSFRNGPTSVVHGGSIRRGIGKIAQLAQAPVLPAVVVNSQAYGKASSWIPYKHVRYGVIFGHPLEPPAPGDETAPGIFESTLCEALRCLHQELQDAMKQTDPHNSDSQPES